MQCIFSKNLSIKFGCAAAAVKATKRHTIDSIHLVKVIIQLLLWLRNKRVKKNNRISRPFSIQLFKFGCGVATRDHFIHSCTHSFDSCRAAGEIHIYVNVNNWLIEWNWLKFSFHNGACNIYLLLLCTMEILSNPFYCHNICRQWCNLMKLLWNSILEKVKYL